MLSLIRLILDNEKQEKFLLLRDCDLCPSMMKKGEFMGETTSARNHENFSHKRYHVDVFEGRGVPVNIICGRFCGGQVVYSRPEALKLFKNNG